MFPTVSLVFLSILLLPAPAVDRNHSFVRRRRGRRLEDDHYSVCLSQIGDVLSGSQSGELDDSQSGERYGGRVSINADGLVVAVGAAWYDGAAGERCGRVQVFERNSTTITGSAAWQQRGTDDFVGMAAFDYLESSALSDDGLIVALGANGNSDNGDDSGHVRVYEYDGRWRQRGDTIVGLERDDRLGFNLALSGDGNILAVGAGALYVSRPGRVHIFEWVGDKWVAKGDSLDGQNDRDRFGRSVAISQDGNIVAVGASGDRYNGVRSGSVQIFEFADDSSWIQLGQAIRGSNEDDQFGFSVSLSSDGHTVAIGANWADINGPESGQVQVHRLVESSNGVVEWNPLGQFLNGDGDEYWFGEAVSLSGDSSLLAVGARMEGEDNNEGLLRMFQLDQNSWKQSQNDIFGALADDDLGKEVALSRDGSTVVTGGVAADTIRPGFAVVYHVDETCQPEQSSLTVAPTSPTTELLTKTPAPITTAPPSTNESTESPTTTNNPNGLSTSSPTTQIPVTGTTSLFPTPTKWPEAPTDGTLVQQSASDDATRVGLISGATVCGVLALLGAAVGFFFFRKYKLSVTHRGMVEHDAAMPEQQVGNIRESTFPSAEALLVDGSVSLRPWDVLATPVTMPTVRPQQRSMSPPRGRVPSPSYAKRESIRADDMPRYKDQVRMCTPPPKSDPPLKSDPPETGKH